MTVRNLKTIGTVELLAEDSKTCLCISERRRKSRIAFEQVTEESEAEFEIHKECLNGQGKKH